MPPVTMASGSEPTAVIVASTTLAARPSGSAATAVVAARGTAAATSSTVGCPSGYPGPCLHLGCLGHQSRLRFGPLGQLRGFASSSRSKPVSSP